jgi:hypothetical protein
MKNETPTLLEIEIAISNYFGVRKYIIVPNISFGLGLHECDLLVVRQTLFALEIEIKRNRADLLKDLKKAHNHDNNKIKELYFAIPKELENSIDLIPNHAGIFLIDRYKSGNCYATLIREAVPNRKARCLTREEYENFLRLGCMRIWSLKKKLYGKIEP